MNAKEQECNIGTCFRDDPNIILERLKGGNRRFMYNSLERPNQSSQRRYSTAACGQKPFAIILSCADSRVPPELIFDTGIADLFVLRVAGNIANSASIGSIEFAVRKLDCRFILVLGHEGCGAVDTAITPFCLMSPQETDLNKLVDAIRDNVKKCNCSHESATRKNIKGNEVKDVAYEAILKDKTAANYLKSATIENTISVRNTLLENYTIKAFNVSIHRGYYELASGKVLFNLPSEC